MNEETWRGFEKKRDISKRHNVIAYSKGSLADFKGLFIRPYMTRSFVVFPFALLNKKPVKYHNANRKLQIAKTPLLYIREICLCSWCK